MDFKAIIILVLSVALAGVLGFMYAKRGNNGMFKRKMKKTKPEAKAKGKGKGETTAMLQPKPNQVKGEANAKGEPAEVQSMVAQYMIENGL